MGGARRNAASTSPYLIAVLADEIVRAIEPRPRRPGRKAAKGSTTAGNAS